jgi:hypothetical protein
MKNTISAVDILRILYVNQGRLLNSSEVADYINENLNGNYDDEVTAIMKRLRKRGLICKDFREPFIGYEISSSGIIFLAAFG